MESESLFNSLRLLTIHDIYKSKLDLLIRDLIHRNVLDIGILIGVRFVGLII